MSGDFRLSVRAEGHDYQFSLIETTPDEADVTLNGVSYSLTTSSDNERIKRIVLAHVGLPKTVEGLVRNIRHIDGIEEVSFTPIAKTHAVAVSSLAAKEAAPVTADRIQAARAYLDKLRSNPRFSGVVLIGVGDDIVAEEVFQSDSVAQKPITTSMPWNIQSMGKKFTEVAIMQLVEEDLISLDTHIRDILTLEDTQLTDAGEFERLSGEDDGACLLSSSVTIRDLLTHRGGLVGGFEAPAQFISEEVGKYHYSNPGFALLAKVVERVTHKSFGDYVNEYIWRPSGITESAKFIHEVPKASDIADHFVSSMVVEDIRPTSATPSPAHGYGCFWMMPKDMCKFALALANGGLFKKPETEKILHTQIYGWEPSSDEFPHSGYTFNGRSRDASSHCSIVTQRDFPDAPIAAVVFSNFTLGADAGDDIMQALCNLKSVQSLKKQEEGIAFLQNLLQLQTRQDRKVLLQEFLSTNPNPSYFFDLSRTLFDRGRNDLISEIAEGLPKELRDDIYTDFSTIPELVEVAKLFKSPERVAAEKMDSLSESMAREAFFSGSVLVEKDGKVLLCKGYGMATDSVPNDSSSRFYIASTSKQFTAAAIMKLQEAGKIDLHKSINNYLPPEYQSEKWEDVTVHHLLSNTSGLYDFQDTENFEERSRSLTVDQMIREEKEKDLEFTPGSQFAYRNVGYEILGSIIEHVSGMAYREYLLEHILIPAGMISSDVQRDVHELDPSTSIGYKLDDEATTLVKVVPKEIRLFRAAGGIISTVSDLAKWSHVLDDGGSVLKKESVALMTTPNIDHYGYGLAEIEMGGKRVIQHNGGLSGYASTFCKYPDDNLFITILSNNQSVALDNLAGRFVNILSNPDSVSVEAVPAEGIDLSKFVGIYKCEAEPFQYNFSLSSTGRLNVVDVSGERPSPIFHTCLLSNGHVFVPEIGLEFEKRADSKMYMYHPTQSDPIDVLNPIEK